MSQLKFARYLNPLDPRPRKSLRQEIQWNLFAALGYTKAIRGYLHCWQYLLKRAGITSPRTLGAIEVALNASSYIEKEIRYQMAHIPPSAPSSDKK